MDSKRRLLEALPANIELGWRSNIEKQLDSLVTDTITAVKGFTVKAPGAPVS